MARRRSTQSPWHHALIGNRDLGDRSVAAIDAKTRAEDFAEVDDTVNPAPSAPPMQPAHSTPPVTKP